MNRNRIYIIGGIAVVVIIALIYFLTGRTTPSKPEFTDEPVEQTPPGSDDRPTNPDGRNGNGGNNNSGSASDDNKPSDLTSILFYEGNGCDQDIIASYKKSMDGKIGENDEARSMKLNDVPAGTTIALYDNPDGKENDDFAVLRVKRRTFNTCISTFESSAYNDIYEMVFNERNGLDGKVSYIRIKFPD